MDLYPMLMGAVAMASFVATVFFLRFWTQTRDTLFLFFAAAFALDASRAWRSRSAIPPMS